jgi:hypothetical protein
MVHRVPVFNIFSGRFDEKEIVWLGAVEGLDAARDSMLQFAAKEPGPFFVFDSQNHAVAASVDTSGPMRAPKSKAKGAASRFHCIW